MPRGPVNFRQADVTKAVKAARAAGIDVARVEIEPHTRRIVVVAKSAETDQGNALDKWMSEHADPA